MEKNIVRITADAIIFDGFDTIPSGDTGISIFHLDNGINIHTEIIDKDLYYPLKLVNKQISKADDERTYGIIKTMFELNDDNCDDSSKYEYYFTQMPEGYYMMVN